MKPYRSGKYVVGNRFLIDLSTGQVSFHCRSSMQLLASQLPPDEPGACSPTPNEQTPQANISRPLTDEDRWAAFAPAVQAALQRPAPAPGCRGAQEDPFWGTGPAEAGDDPDSMADIAAAAAHLAAMAGQDAATRLRVTIIVEHERDPAPARPTRPWTDSDEAFYQTATMWECAVYHWYE